jgi:hypothetical protein
MRFQTTGMLLVGATVIAGTAAAQNTPAPPATVRTVIAAAKLPTVSDVPLYFSVASVELAPGLTSSVSKANGILYQLSGSTSLGRWGGENDQSGRGIVHRHGKECETQGGQRRAIDIPALFSRSRC